MFASYAVREHPETGAMQLDRQDQESKLGARARDTAGACRLCLHSDASLPMDDALCSTAYAALRFVTCWGTR